MKLAANLIFVNDVAAAQAWYEKVLGMEHVSSRLPEFLEMKLGENTFWIETHNDKRAEGFNEVKIGGRHSAVFAVEDIKKTIEEMRAKGVTIVREPVQQFWGGWNAVIADPDGNEFILDEDK